MKFIELQLTHFGKFHHRVIPLQAGINVVEGKNEAGKSTIHAFIGAMLFGLERGKRSAEIYDRYLPWENQGGYGGALRFEEQGHVYFLERSFLKSNPTIRLRDETAGKELVPAGQELKRLLGGLTESGYRNTVSIGQMQGATDEGLSAELKSSIESLGMAKNMDIDLTAASEGLMRRRKSLEKDLVSGAEEEQDKLSSSVYQISQELTRKLEEAAGLEEQLEEGRSREYQEFSSKQEERERLKKELEDVNQEHSRLLSEKERWEKERDNAKGSLGRQFELLTDADIENGMAKRLIQSLAPEFLAVGIILLIFAQVCLMSYIRLMTGKEELFSYSLYLGIGSAVLGVAALITAFVLHRKHKKHLNYYRLLVDKHMRLKESDAALKSIENKKTALLEQISQESSGEYYQLHEQNETLEKEIMRLEWEQDQTVERLNTAKKQLAAAKIQCRRNQVCRQHIQAVRMAMEHLFAAADEIQDTFGDEMNAKASEYLKTLTGGAYTALSYEGKEKITLQSGTRRIALEQVSRGTVEQVYLCIRLAASDCLSPNVSMPLLLDDTFAFYDDTRTKNALELLKHSGHQVLIMTCHGREKKLLNQQ
jgi:DNA repair exonuclease SbcCD ATPase subunit